MQALTGAGQDAGDAGANAASGVKPQAARAETEREKAEAVAQAKAAVRGEMEAELHQAKAKAAEATAAMAAAVQRHAAEMEAAKNRQKAEASAETADEEDAEETDAEDAEADAAGTEAAEKEAVKAMNAAVGKAAVKAMNIAVGKQRAKVVKAEATYTEANRLLYAYCSITVQNVFALDKSANTYQCFFELDFKYEVNQYLDVFSRSSVEVDDDDNVSANSFQIPWIIPNALEKTVERESHFFRVKEKKEDPGPKEMSMYDDDDDRIRLDKKTGRLRAEQSRIAHSVRMDQIISGLVVKHEKIVMTATLRYNTDSSLEPLDQIFACIKVATDGRPGTKRTKIILAESDCSFDGFEQGLAGYEPYRAPMKQGLAGKGASLFRRLLALCSWHSKMREGLGKAEVFALTFDFEQSYSGQYPRIYFFQRFKHPNHVWWEDYFRYYLTSYVLTLLLAAVHPGYTFSVSASDAFNGGRSNRSWTPESNDLNQNDLVALFSGIFLADIALLFTASANGSKESYNQKAITKNLLSAIMLAICMFYGYYEQDGMYYGLPRWIQITVVFTVATSVLLYTTVSHYFKALQKNTRIAESISKFGTSLPTVKQRADKAKKQAEQAARWARKHEAKTGLAGRYAAKLARQEAKQLKKLWQRLAAQAGEEMEEETQAEEETEVEMERKVQKTLMQKALKYLDTL